MPESPNQDEVADALHDAMLRELAVLCPTGSDRKVPISTLCDALVTLLAAFLIAAQPDMPADAQEIERLTRLFRQRLAEAMAERSGPRGGPVGHA